MDPESINQGAASCTNYSINHSTKSETMQMESRNRVRERERSTEYGPAHSSPSIRADSMNALGRQRPGERWLVAAGWCAASPLLERGRGVGQRCRQRGGSSGQDSAALEAACEG